MGGTAGALAETPFPDRSAFHAEIDENLRRLLAYPRPYLSVHFLPDGSEVPELPVMARDELPVRDPGFREPLSNKLPQVRRETEGPQAYPGDSARIDGLKYISYGLPVTGLPFIIKNDGIEMESKSVAPFLALNRGSQTRVKRWSPKLLRGADAPGIHRP